MKLKKIFINNYKGVDGKLEIDLSVLSNKAKGNLKNNKFYAKENDALIPNIVGFIGKNASGKSSIIEAVVDGINFVFNPSERFLNFYSRIIFSNASVNVNMINPDRQKAEQQLKELEIINNKKMQEFASLNFENQKKYHQKEYEEFLKNIWFNFSNDQKNSFSIELSFLNGKNEYKAGFEISNNSYIRWAKKNDVDIDFNSFPSILFDPTFYDANPQLVPLVLRNQVELLNLIGENKYNNLLSFIDDNIKGISVIKNNDNILNFNSILMNNESIIDFSYLSDGTKKILELVYRIMKNDVQRELTVIVADEINNFLHSKLIDFIFKLIINFQPKKQLIFSTHSPSVISLLDRHSILLIHKEEQIKIEKASKLRENNNFYKKFISEEISSHPSSSEMEELLYEWDK